MALATIYRGNAELLTAYTVDRRVTSTGEYVQAYNAIVTALHAGQSITVGVSDGTAATWLEVLVERYGHSRVQIEHVSRRGQLEKQWNVGVPDWVSEEDIKRAGLLNVHIPAAPGRSFEDHVLDVLFNPYFTASRLPLDQLSQLLERLDPMCWEEARQRPLVGDIFQRRLKQWEQQAEADGERVLVEWLRRSPDELRRKLALLRVLANYPTEVRRRVLGKHFDMLHGMNLDLRGITVHESEVREAEEQIRVHLHELLRSHDVDEALVRLLEQASGHLEIEFDAVQNLLRSGNVHVDRELVRRVRQLFRPLQHQPHLEQALADLDLLLTQPPPSPPDPDGNWSTEQWLGWAEREYLPYRFWREETGELTGDVVRYADAYADWLYKSYPALRLNSPRMIYRALPDLRPRMMGSAPVLVVIIDNFNAKFFRDLQRYMQESGYYNEDTSYHLSMLPSATEVSKKCLVIGSPEPFPGTAYEKIVQDTWTRELGGRRVLYLPHVGALRSVRKREHDVYFLNYLPLDIVFHRDEEHVGISHAQAARSYLRALTRDIRGFAERIGAEQDLVVIVLSDHGSTRIPADAPNLIDEKFFKRRVEDRHHRYVKIEESELRQLPDNVAFQCYTFDQERFGLAHHYLAARQHYRFLETSVSTYIHGGLTPEETLIPVAIFTPQQVEPKPLTLRLLDTKLRVGLNQLRFEITNSNSYPCKELRLEILDSAVEASSTELAELAATSRAMVTVEARLRRAQGKIEQLHLSLDYLFLEQPREQSESVDVDVQAMMTQAFDITDLV